MTFDSFKASGRDTLDIGNEPEIRDGGLQGCKGRVYLDCLYIEDSSAWERSRGAWSLMLGNMEYASDTLEELERMLFDWAVSEGYDLP